MSVPSLCLMAALGAATLSAQAADVGVSVQIQQPGVYGRIDLGRFPQPQVVVAQPVLVAPPPQHLAPPPPAYLWVPPGHQKHWRQHCHRYQACGQPVYFVRDGWYRQQVLAVPPVGGPPPGRGHGHGRGHRD